MLTYQFIALQIYNFPAKLPSIWANNLKNFSPPLLNCQKSGTFAAYKSYAIMIELNYDGHDAEMFPLITEQGEVVGQASRRYCHSGSMALHPVVHLHIFDRQGRLYLQKRSMKKDIAPGLWDTSVGGHVDYGESLLRAVLREAREEVGIEAEASQIRFLFQYVWQSARERELVTAYALTTDLSPTPDHDEVDEGRFFTLTELQQRLATGFFTQQFEEQELHHLLQAIERSEN